MAKRKRAEGNLNAWLEQQRTKMHTPVAPWHVRLRWWWWNVAPRAVARVGMAGAMVNLAEWDWTPQLHGGGISWLVFHIWWR